MTEQQHTELVREFTAKSPKHPYPALDVDAMFAEIVRLRACTGGRMTRACATCACWDAADPDADSGLCRRHAPRPTVGHDGSITTDWAITERADWCGEYEATREATT